MFCRKRVAMKRAEVATQGPVFAAAVILPRDFFHPLLNDSKQLTAEERYELRPIIEEKAIDYAVGIVHEEDN